MRRAHRPRPWTYADLAAIPDDLLRHELIDGEHVVTPSPGPPHQLILWNLSGILGPYVLALPLFPGLRRSLREVFHGR